jgi:ribosomal protein S18 acetylase RimI-like enzyme
MNPKSLAIVPLDPAHKNQAADLLTRAFQDDPAYTHIFPDPAERARSLRSLWGGLLTMTLRYGQVYSTPALHGVACWMAPGDGGNSLWQSLRTGFALQRPVFGFSSAARKRFLDVIGHLEQVRKQAMPRPHWYLWALGVDPPHQGQGVGGHLLQPVLAKADAAGLPSYLETETERNVAFYRKHGFEVATAGPDPRQGVMVWTMVRQPQAPGA